MTVHKTHCKHGHAYTGDNVRFDRHGWQICVACTRARDTRRCQAGQSEYLEWSRGINEQVALLARQGFGPAEIGKELGITASAARNRKRRLGIDDGRIGNRKYDYDEIRALFDRGFDVTEVCRRTGVPRDRVRTLATEWGFREPLPNPRELLPGKLEKARVLLEDGASYGEVVRTLHISRTVLRKHFPGYGWSSVEGGRLGGTVKAFNRMTARL